MSKNHIPLGKDEIVSRLGALASAAPETGEACELLAASLQSRWGTTLRMDATASIDALSAARPDLQGWNWIRTMLGVNEADGIDHSQVDDPGTLYDVDGNPNPDGLW